MKCTIFWQHPFILAIFYDDIISILLPSTTLLFFLAKNQRSGLTMVSCVSSGNLMNFKTQICGLVPTNFEFPL
jgi:hypothetical protein